jgi:membrane-associated phospholipid phosphatase
VQTTARERARVPAGAREAALVLFLILTYFGVRGLTEARIERAFANADVVMRLERTLGVAWEAQLQSLIVGHQSLVTLVNWIYIYGHWPVILTCAAVLYVRRRRHYLLLRDAMIVSALIGFAFFAFLPVAPPRLADATLVDTVTRYSEGYRTLQPPGLTNQYAAVPSLHVGWNLLVAIALFLATRRLVVRAFAVAMPFAMAFAAVATANHFIIDVVAGTAVVLVALALSIGLRARTLDVGGQQARTNALAAPTVRHRAPLRQLARRPADGRGGRRARDRGGRAPLPGAPRGAPSEDARSRPDPLGPMEAREPVRPAAPPR